MSVPPRTHAANAGDAEPRPVLVPAGNKARLAPVARKPLAKPMQKVEKGDLGAEGERNGSSPAANSRPLLPARSASTVLRRQEKLLHSNWSLNASCSSDCSTDSFHSRASTGRIGSRASLSSRKKQLSPRPDKILSKLEKILPDADAASSPEIFQGKKRCSWVTPNTESCYATFHDEEWGVPIHDDKRLFELLVLSGALAELTWPVILSKRNIFREVFLDFDPVAVSKLSEKKITAQGSTANSLLSEPKLRGIIENARQILKIIEEFGSFDRYCWSFVNHKPVISKFRYSRQVPVKTAKADFISKDMVRRGFRCVGPTVIYSFMQVSGMTNDHLITCFRFEECCAPQPPPTLTTLEEKDVSTLTNCKIEEDSSLTTTDTSITTEEDANLDVDLPISVNGLSIS